MKVETVRKAAVISGDDRYRYRLEREWDADRTQLGWVMLNPSTADSQVDDATIRKCMKYARTWGFGGIVVVNLFAYRAREPEDLDPLSIHEATGPENWQHVSDVVGAYDTVAGWGAEPKALESPIRTDVMRWGRARSQMHAPVLALALTKAGEPRHPLYLKDDLSPFLWPPDTP